MTAFLWHLGVERAVIKKFVHTLVSVKLLDAVDDSMKFSDDETDSDTDNQPFFAFASTTNQNDGSDEDSGW